MLLISDGTAVNFHNRSSVAVTDAILLIIIGCNSFITKNILLQVFNDFFPFTCVYTCILFSMLFCYFCCFYTIYFAEYIIRTGV